MVLGVIDSKAHLEYNLLGIGNFNAIFGQSKPYRSGREMSIPSVSGLNMREAGCEKGLAGHCPPLVHRIFPRYPTPWGEVKWVKGKGIVVAQGWSRMEKFNRNGAEARITGPWRIPNFHFQRASPVDLIFPSTMLTPSGYEE